MKQSAKETVVVLGASPKPERYSNKAVRLLLEHGHAVIPVHPAMDSIEGIAVRHALDDIEGAVDTVTVYVSPELSSPLAEQLVALGPRRVIFNPGTENPVLIKALDAAGIATEQACTLVLLNTGQF